MSDFAESINPSPGIPTLPSVKPPREDRPLLAAFLSAVVPGAGQLLLGQRRKGAVIAGLFALLVFAFWPLRLLRFYFGFAGLYLCWIAFYVYAACSAAMARHLPAPARPSKWWLALVLPITLLTMSLIGAGVTRLSGFRSFLVPSSSMEKTIREGDRIVADMNYYRSRSPGKQDVIMFKKDGGFFIKRIIGASGDSVEGKDGVIFVNGQRLDEAYVQHIGEPPDWRITSGPTSFRKGNTS
jgi:signal peptidase I